MRGDLLRDAISAIREDQDRGMFTDHEHRSWFAVIDWLDGLLDAMTNPDAPNSGITTAREERAAVAVCRAYLRGPS